MLRSAAHFAVDAVLLPPGSGLSLSGSACRVAEGGAEAVPLIRLGDRDTAIAQLQAAGYQLAATLPHGAPSLYAQPLPSRLVLVFGAEQTGMSAPLLAACGIRLGIPGSGAVESLNISAAAAVFVAEWRRCHPLAVITAERQHKKPVRKHQVLMMLQVFYSPFFHLNRCF